MAGGRRRKRVNKPKSRQSTIAHAEDELSEVTEELTALSAIFQEDFTLISESPFKEFSIVLQPHSGEIGSHQNVSAELYVRCLPGYPNKPPKLQVKSKEGLSEEEARSLHSMLVNQASSISREGRVMIFNLVEAGQEFLSEHIRNDLSQDQQEDEEATSTGNDLWVAVSNSMPYSSQEPEVPSVYGVVDLFTELDEEYYWTVEPKLAKNIESQKNVGGPSTNVVQEPLAVGYLGAQKPISVHGGEDNTLALQGPKKKQDKYLVSDSKSKDLNPQVATERLSVVNEKDENVDVCKPNAIQFSSVTELLQNLYTGMQSPGCKNTISEEQKARLSLMGHIEQEVKTIFPMEATHLGFKDGPGVSVRKDFLLVHLLRLVCCPRGPLPHALPTLALQLQKLDMTPQWTTDMLCNQPELFDMAFHSIFADCIREINGSSENLAAVKSFWNASPDLLGKGDSAHPRVTSRYANDFEEISLLGKGGFGHVVLCRNKLDGRQYAIKKIRLKDKSLSLNNKIRREVATLSRLQHRHVVRYYQAWFETVLEFMNSATDLETSEEWIASGTIDYADLSFMPQLTKGLMIGDIEEKLVETAYLYIQMEYCPRTLRKVLNSSSMDEATVWVMFRQIVEGLAHIHGQGIIHRDLNPSNIFFDGQNDIKIGDFGLAKFTNLEQPERELLSTIDPHGGSLDGTGQVGTYFYTAPEIEQCWPHINEKVDMYSLGVVLFELWHPFATAMERHIVLSELKNKGVPSSWAVNFPQQAALVKSLMAPNPADRPSAMHVLRNNLPPRMEDEALDDVLRTIQRGDHSYVFDQITSALFDEKRLSLVAQKLDIEEFISSFTPKTFIQDHILAIAKEVFMCHGAHRFSSHSMSLINDGQLSRRGQAVRLMDSAGRMLELRSETRIHFAGWVAAKQVTSIKRFEISQVYRKAAGPSTPQEYYQGDFDIIGETFGLAEAESIKVVVDIILRSSITDSFEICINHANILEAIWSWSGVKSHQRRDVAKLLSSGGFASPQSSDRKSRWVHIRRQLMQGLQLSEDVVDRLQTVERRWNGPPEEGLSRIRGGLADSALISSAMDELAALQSYLRVWSIGKHVHVDALMAPPEEYYKGLYFQVYIPKGCCHATSLAGMLLAVGGRYDQLVQHFWSSSLALPAPGAVGISVALEKLIFAATSESSEPETVAEVLVCSKGGGGMLRERMEVASELWDGSIKAEFVHSPSPSLTEQYEHAREHGIKWLVIITEAGLEHTNSVKVRHMDLRLEEDISRANLVRFFSDTPVTATDIKKQAALLREGN